ncbi:hypothetical protein PFICI_00275 [Pestalotiopsis fici W106-1]|uniref:Uncharacterized protein n=1 Tax=Pestalotiopsis fici (strain W106-1 / CGMCC3.15140) TaxID=1229662 RepID=W3XLU6_PESFW|nr:uncharacterized protein PFICI_00275 [Pestalotiopsis fici W106-1]ETS86447.1 hypothetical protein PFICI_00275 [Pestalotiopsis fici W106-1]
MQEPNIPDHDKYWADNEELQGRIRNYHDWAQSILNKTESRLFGPEIRHPWMKNEHDLKSRISIFQLEGEYCCEGGCKFEEARDMLKHWKDTPKDGSSESINRRVILVEGMHPRVIELLGVLLKIPPHFFLAHCSEWVDLQFIDAAYSKQDGSTYWKVPIPCRLSIPKGLSPGNYLFEVAALSRGEIEVEQDTTDVEFRKFVSYWGAKHGSGSWTGT